MAIISFWNTILTKCDLVHSLILSFSSEEKPLVSASIHLIPFWGSIVWGKAPGVNIAWRVARWVYVLCKSSIVEQDNPWAGLVEVGRCLQNASVMLRAIGCKLLLQYILHLFSDTFTLVGPLFILVRLCFMWPLLHFSQLLWPISSSNLISFSAQAQLYSHFCYFPLYKNWGRNGKFKTGVGGVYLWIEAGTELALSRSTTGADRNY